MRALIAIAALLALGGCGHNSGADRIGQVDHSVSGFLQAAAKRTYTLAIVSGDGQSGHANQALSTPFTQVSPTLFTRTPLPPVILEPLVVEVRDEQGQLADDVEVQFRPEWITPPDASGNGGVLRGPLYLGSSVSGWACASYYPATHGRAAVIASAYLLGPQHASCSVDERWGSSSTVTFTIEGVP